MRNENLSSVEVKSSWGKSSHHLKWRETISNVSFHWVEYTFNISYNFVIMPRRTKKTQEKEKSLDKNLYISTKASGWDEGGEGGEGRQSYVRLEKVATACDLWNFTTSIEKNPSIWALRRIFAVGARCLFNVRDDQRDVERRWERQSKAPRTNGIIIRTT